jgi:hypothetical protein
MQKEPSITKSKTLSIYTFTTSHQAVVDDDEPAYNFQIWGTDTHRKLEIGLVVINISWNMPFDITVLLPVSYDVQNTVAYICSCLFNQFDKVVLGS